MSSDDTTSYPVEFLNSLDLSEVPSHKLELKVGVPVLLMRNLDAPRLCNGTRLRITELGRHIVKTTILTGEAKGDNVLIPRIPIIPNNLWRRVLCYLLYNIRNGVACYEYYNFNIK
ncbi:ATP-dependent DNA helicase [Trichonephila clavipes]|nr:ATP-dependent DNA helicase [Trichonephila clavipes]